MLSLCRLADETDGDRRQRDLMAKLPRVARQRQLPLALLDALWRAGTARCERAEEGHELF